MFNSLRARLLATLLIVLIVALGTIAFYISRTTTSEFERSLSSILRYRDPRLDTKINNIQKTITLNRGERGIWDTLQAQIEQIQSSSQIRIVMTDLAGVVYADSAGKLSGAELNTKVSKPFAAFLVEKTPILAYYEPLNAPNIGDIQGRFTTSVNRSLLLAVIAAGSVTLLLTVLLSASILRPISALTSAAHKMERGDLSQRVDVKTRGELGELALAFNAMADGLDRLEQLRRNMVTDVAHELRTPLSNIRGYLEALRDEMLEPTPQVISLLHEEAMGLNHLVDELQELALAEAGQLHMERRPVEIAETVHKAINTVNQQASMKGVTINATIADDLPPAYSDPERLHQILRNLLDNAITYTPTNHQITVNVQQSNDSIEFSIADTGSGIAPEHLPYIFERFYRADKSRTRATGGAGLGLAIVKQLVEALGGQVHVESTPGKGTEVSFTTPIVTSGMGDETDKDQLTSGLWRPAQSN
jgi:signal transduction histidine kinase